MVLELLAALGSQLVVADIAPLALASAAVLSLPAILIENFTWDWIYCNYSEAPSQLRRHGRRLEEVFAGTDLRIQTEPLCDEVSGAVRVPPVARPSRRSRNETRRALGIPLDAPMVVVSMGGVPWNSAGFSATDLGLHDPWVVVPGGSVAAPRRRGRLVLLPFHSEFYHPDLAGAADAVVSKLGYSTVAEAHFSGAAIVYVERPRFPESPVLARWVEANMTAVGISETALDDGGWLKAASALLERPRHTPGRVNGARRGGDSGTLRAAVRIVRLPDSGMCGNEPAMEPRRPAALDVFPLSAAPFRA